MSSTMNNTDDSNSSNRSNMDSNSKPDVLPTITVDSTHVSGSHVVAGAVSEIEDSISDIEYAITEPATVENEDESEYEYEDEDDAGLSSFLLSDIPLITNVVTSSISEPARIEEEMTIKWKEPSKEAVSMSLRAERETTGGKRRLASDLYKIMTRDTEEAGFSLEPKDEEKMDKWLIKLFQFDKDSNLAKDMEIVGVDHVEIEMSFPDQYPFEPPFVRVVRPKFKRQTGFVMNGALCMELLTKEGWNPINDIESVIVSIRSLLVVGDGRLTAAADLSEANRTAILDARKRKRNEDGTEKAGKKEVAEIFKTDIGAYSAQEAKTAYEHLSEYHKKKGWDTSGWWAKKG